MGGEEIAVGGDNRILVRPFWGGRGVPMRKAGGLENSEGKELRKTKHNDIYM